MESNVLFLIIKGNLQHFSITQRLCQQIGVFVNEGINSRNLSFKPFTFIDTPEGKFELVGRRKSKDIGLLVKRCEEMF